MIYLGAQLGGPEVEVTVFRHLLKQIATAFDDPPDEDIAPAPSINLVFFVPGSISDYADIDTIRIERYSRKRNLMIVAAPVAASIVQSHAGSTAYILTSLREAISLATNYFAEKGVLGFDNEAAKAVLLRVTNALEVGRL